MPRGKKMQTPSKQPESSSMTHEEEEEMLHDISKLRDQVQQISLSQRTTKYELKFDMDGLKGDIDGLKGDMDGLKCDINGLKSYIESLKEGLKTLLQERLPGGDNVIHENHDEDKRNMKYDFRDSNVGIKNHHIPKIDMKKFDGKDLVTWILQMEQYFDLHDVKTHTKGTYCIFIFITILICMV